MGVKHFKDLRAWQAADALRQFVIAFTDREPANRHGRFCDSARSAAADVCRAIAEGFGRYEHAEFAQFLQYALASIDEVEDHVIEGRESRYLDDDQYRTGVALVGETRANTRALLMSVATTSAPTNIRRRPRSQRARGTPHTT